MLIKKKGKNIMFPLEKKALNHNRKILRRKMEGGEQELKRQCGQNVYSLPTIKVVRSRE